MVSIITINYNGWQDTCELIASLKQYENYPYEIIVVDNASCGEDVKFLRAAYPDVQVIVSKENLGFAGGNNLGYRYAKGEYIFFLNNDMVVKSPVLSPLVNCLKGGYFAGVSPCIMFLYDSERIQYYGYRDMSPITLKHTTESFDATRRDDFLQPGETEVLHGGAMMVRRDVIKCVGMMSEAYFLFYEEFDWSHRVRKAGYHLFYEPASVVFHKESMTIKPQTPVREYYLTRARIIYARRNCRGADKLLSCLYQLVLAVPKKTLSYLLKGRMDLVKSIWQGAVSGLLLNLRDE